MGNEKKRKKRKEKKEKKHHHSKNKKEKKRKKEKLNLEIKEIKEINENDYYNKGSEFRTWLFENKKIYIEDIETEEAKQLFKKFVKLWNHKELSEKYYKGMNIEEEDPSQRTKYKWSFVKNLDPVEMGNTRDSVIKDTNKLTFSDHIGSAINIIGPQLPFKKGNEGEEEELDEAELERKQEFELWKKKKEDKDYRKHKELILEELVPKPTGKEAMIEKKKMKSLKMRSTKDEDMDTELGDHQMYGNSIEEFKKRLEREKEKKLELTQKKLEEGEKKLEEYRRKEAEKMAPFLEIIKSGQIPLLQQKKNQQSF